MTDNEKLIAATKKLQEMDHQLKESDSINQWPIAFGIAAMWLSLGWMIHSLCNMVINK